jgi:hypothetical protein
MGTSLLAGIVLFVGTGLPIKPEKGIESSLSIIASCSERARVGDEIAVEIRVTNKSRAAKPIQLKAKMSPGLRHPVGSDIEAELKEVQPEKEQIITLKLKAVGVGQQCCSIFASCADEQKVTAKVQILIGQTFFNQVLRALLIGPNSISNVASRLSPIEDAQPELKLALKAPEKGRVGDEIDVEIRVTNNSRETRRIQLHAELSAGLNHSVGRNIEADLPEIHPQEEQTVILKLKVVDCGQQTCFITACRSRTLPAIARVQITIDETFFKQVLGALLIGPNFVLKIVSQLSTNEDAPRLPPISSLPFFSFL